MANRPCFGLMPCACGRQIPIFWNGNTKIVCPYCHRKFMSKRQKLTKVQMAKCGADISGGDEHKNGT